MSTDDQVEALTAAVRDLDASRRVGWGKAYGAAGKLEDALRDYNIARGDADRWRQAAHYLHGYLNAIEDRLPHMQSIPKRDERRRYLTALGVLDPSGDKSKHGRDDGAEVIDQWLAVAPEMAARRAERSAARRRGRLCERDERRHMEDLARQYRLAPRFIRLVLKAARDAMRDIDGRGAARREMRDGSYAVTVRFERGKP